MATLAAIEKQISQLVKQKEALFKAEAKEAARKAMELIARFGLTAEDVGLAGKPKKAAGKKAAGKKAAKPAAGVPKYRDPASGKTWTGQGKPPGWIAGAADRGAFLITTTGQVPEVASTESKAATKKAAKKIPAAAANVATAAGVKSKPAKAVKPVKASPRKESPAKGSKLAGAESQAASAPAEVAAG